MTTRREFVVGAAGMAAAMAVLKPSQAGAAAGLLPTLDEFYAPDYTADTALSPNGERIAILHNLGRGPDQVDSWIEIVDLRNLMATPKRIPLGAHEASGVSWANDNRLLVRMIFDVTRRDAPTERIVRLVAMQDDGGKPIVLFNDDSLSLRHIHDLGTVIDSLPDDPDHILMFAWDFVTGLPALFRVDVNTGDSKLIEHGIDRTEGWMTRNGEPMVRFDSDLRGANRRVMVRAVRGGPYRLIRSIPYGQLNDFDIFGPAETPGVFLVATREAGEDKASVREIDLASLKIGAPLYPARSVDAEGAWFDRRHNLLATTWIEDSRVYAFKDKAFAPHFGAIQRHFGPDITIRLDHVDEAHRWFLGFASGSQQPGQFFLYDRESHTVVDLGSVAPRMTPDRLGKTHLMEVKTRDGQIIRAYLTAPASGAPGPLIVMPHGGPEIRDDGDFDLWTQALAARGWWVLRPNFRGSGGYGRAFATAGWGRWGDRMQEDVEDAVAQAIATFKLDATRVAGVGASYGGYAVLMGAVRQPDLYKAVVSIAGVTDLPDILEWELRGDDLPEKYSFNFWKARIGDPKTQAEALAKASPRRRADEIKAPVLMIHGQWDETVPIDQSRIMARALRKANKPVELVELPREGHSPSTPKVDREELRRTVEFLERALA